MLCTRGNVSNQYHSPGQPQNYVRICNISIHSIYTYAIKRGCDEVHLIFDNPTMLQNTPKYFVHERRDKSTTIHSDHCCDTITSKTKIPKRWRENLLNCRECSEALLNI